MNGLTVDGGVGGSPRRRDAPAKVTGWAQYPADRMPAGSLVAKVVFSGQPHARMLRFDASAARAVPGVVAVIVAADVPVNEYGLTMFDQPVLVGLGGTDRASVDPTVSRWEADQVAVVVADGPNVAAATAIAEAAAELIEIEWEALPVLADVDRALAAGAPLLHPENGESTNTYITHRIRCGDVESGWAAADIVVEGTYEFPYQEHAYLQPEAAVSYVDDDGRLTVEIAGQWTHEDQEQIAHALDVPLDRVRVIYPAIGGAFGGREDMSLQIVMALAAQIVAATGDRRPISCRWSREESIVGHHKRHRGRVTARLGATAEGVLTALEADGHLDAGGYNYTTNKVLGNLMLGLPGPYRVPNARIDVHGVYTNAAIGGAFRGFGGPQGAFVAECQMNKLAHALGLDPAEVRRRNALDPGDLSVNQTPFPVDVTVKPVLEACLSAAGWGSPAPERPSLSPFATLPPAPGAVRHGRGVAAGLKNVGFSAGFPERCVAKIVLHGDPGGDEITGVDLYHSGAEVGQGAHQAFLQMAAEAVGVPFDLVRGFWSDTSITGDSGSASASRLTFMAGNSILGAAEEADKAWRNGDRPAVGEFRYTPPPTEHPDPLTGEGTPNFCYAYMAQVVDVDVDIETGHVAVRRVVSAHDVGRVINHELARGQVEGAVVQAHGYAVTEDLHVVDGFIRNPRLSSYLIPGIGDIPDRVDTVLLELGDANGPFGAKGLAEMPYITYAPAVVAAVHDATGVWLDTFPLTPSRVLAGLRAARLA